MIPNYARAEIKDALALLRLAAMPDDRQSDEAFRRVVNEPRRGFGSKTIEVLERDAEFFGVSLLKAVETAALPPKTKEAGLQFVHAVRAVAEQGSLTLADQLSLLLDRTGYREMLRMSRAENMEPKLENLAELVNIAGGFHTVRELLDHAALATDRAGQGDGDTVSLMTLHKAKGLDPGSAEAKDHPSREDSASSSVTLDVAAKASVAVTSAGEKACRREDARLQGYTGDACPECGNFTLARNGTCLKCATCGATTGCS